MGYFEESLLTLVTFLPLATGLLLAVPVLNQLPDRVWRGIALASTVLTFLLSLRLFLAFDPTRPGYQFVEQSQWLPEYGIRYFVGIDGISLLLVVMTTFLMPIVLLASWNEIQRSVKSYLFFMLFLETGMLGAFVSLNLFLFYVFWELMLIPMYFIIGIWGGPRRVYAAVKFFLFTMLGSLLMLVAMLVVYYLHYDQFGVLNLDLARIPGRDGAGLLETVIPVSGQAVWWQTQGWLFAAFALAFGIKVPMVPLHTWLPDAHVEAPTFPVASVELAPVIFGLALVGILYGSLVAMVQADIKKLVAYSSVAHLGFVMLGIFAVNIEGLEGGVLQMVNHGLSTGALFLLVGMLYERRHTREIAQFGGVAKPMPVFAALFGIVVMSSIGLPMLNGFVGEFLILLGAFEASPAFAIPATFGVVLAAAYLLWAYRRIFFGPVDNPENQSLIDLDLREKFIMVAILVPIFWIGIYPDTFLRRLDASVLELMRTMERRAELTVEAPDPRADDDLLVRALAPGDR
jgi:NADH-quinone oxidoreductase subunit M